MVCQWPLNTLSLFIWDLPCRLCTGRVIASDVFENAPESAQGAEILAVFPEVKGAGRSQESQDLVKQGKGRDRVLRRYGRCHAWWHPRTAAQAKSHGSRAFAPSALLKWHLVAALSFSGLYHFVAPSCRR